MIDGGGGDPLAVAGVVGAVDGEVGVGADDAAAFDGTAHNEMIAAPAVVGALAVALEGAAKIGG